jgi:pentose-5-phosphate-3-epimerase
MSETKIAPSLLAADFGNLQRDIELVNKSGQGDGGACHQAIGRAFDDR